MEKTMSERILVAYTSLESWIANNVNAVAGNFRGCKAIAAWSESIAL